LARLATFSLVFSAMLAAPSAVSAQASEGFLFKEPRVSFAFKFGYQVPMAGSQVYDFVQDELTVNRSDFNTMSLGAELALRVSPRVDIALEIGRGQSSTPSEFREFVDTDDLPIEQVTEVTRTPITVGATYYLQDRGRRVSSLAWVPAAWAPFVGAGVGLVSYSFVQSGDFVDFDTFDIFADYFETAGTALTAHGLAGLEYAVSPRMALTGEGRYFWAQGDMGGDFVDFDALDLSGFQASLGFKLRF